MKRKRQPEDDSNSDADGNRASLPTRLKVGEGKGEETLPEGGMTEEERERILQMVEQEPEVC